MVTLTVAAVTFLAFVPALHGQFLDWDDDTNFVRNQEFRGLGLSQIAWMFSKFHYGHYQPISWLTLGWDFVWGRALLPADPALGPGMNPLAFHFTNVLLHAVNAVLVYLLAVRLMAVAWFGDRRRRTVSLHLAAAAAALLFSIHPLRVENVAWITERRDLVNACFLLLAVLAYLRAAQSSGRSRFIWLATSIGLYVLCLMSKVSGVPLIAALIALDWYPLRRIKGTTEQSARSVWFEKVPFVVAAMVFAYIAVRGQSADHWLYPLERHSMDARVVQSFHGLVFYLWKTIAPVNLLPLYELRSPLNLGDARFILSIALVVMASIGLMILFLRGKGKAVIVAMVCYAAFLGPVLGLFQNGPQLVADRYSYLPSIGLMIVLAGGVAWFLARRGSPRIVQSSVFAAVAVVIVALSALTWRQCRVWETSESLWAYTLKHDQVSAVANNGYGVVLSQARRQPDQAVAYFQKAVAIEPSVKFYRANLRNALRDAGRMPELIAAWVDEYEYSRRAIGVGQFDAAWHYSAGVEAANARDLPRALEHYQTSLALNEPNLQAHHNCAVTLEQLNHPNQAIGYYRRAVELDRHNIHSRMNLADLLRRLNRSAEAEPLLKEVLQIDPNNANARAALARIQQGR